MDYACESKHSIHLSESSLLCVCNLMTSQPIHFPPNHLSLFFFMDEYNSIVYIHHIFLSGWFYIVVIGNNGAVQWMCRYVSLTVYLGMILVVLFLPFEELLCLFP